MNEPYLNAFRCPKLIAELAATEIPFSAVVRQGRYETFGRPWRLVYLGDPLFQFHQDSITARRKRAAPRLDEALIPTRSRWTGTVIDALDRPPPHPMDGDASSRLQWCLTAAIRALCQQVDPPPPVSASAPSREVSPDWTSVLLKIDRLQLEPRLKPVLDELVTDTLLNVGKTEELFGWLWRISPAERSSRDRRTIETMALGRLASLAGSQA